MQRIVRLKSDVLFTSYSAVGGGEESRGRYGKRFDLCDKSDMFGMPTFELAEGEMGRCAMNLALGKAGLSHDDIDLLVAGDLQNQCVASALGLYTFGLPYLGLYGACSTCAESLLCLSLALSHGPLERGAAVTSSHNAAAERQFRLPLEYGGQRTPSAAWTATAAGAFVLGKRGRVKITEGIVGRLIDGAITDASNMGAAMAPAAADSILAYLRDGAHPLSEIDLVITGDLGRTGSRLLCALLAEEGISLGEKHKDCGSLIYDPKHSDSHSGGSGCGCSASLLACHFLPMLERGELSRILFFSTGALMSPQSTLQKNNIFGIAHGILIEREN